MGVIVLCSTSMHLLYLYVRFVWHSEPVQVLSIFLLVSWAIRHVHYLVLISVSNVKWSDLSRRPNSSHVHVVIISRFYCLVWTAETIVTIPRSHWVEPSRHAYNSRTMYATDTKLAKSTALHDPAIILEAGSCKPSVTKLASILHTSLRRPQLCSLWNWERLPDCHMTSWRHDYEQIFAPK